MPIMTIRERREASGLSQVALGVQMGCGQSTVASWETEVALPKARDLPRLARVLRCSISDLFVEPTVLEPDGDPDPCYYDDTASEE